MFVDPANSYQPDPAEVTHCANEIYFSSGSRISWNGFLYDDNLTAEELTSLASGKPSSNSTSSRRYILFISNKGYYALDTRDSSSPIYVGATTQEADKNLKSLKEGKTPEQIKIELERLRHGKKSLEDLAEDDPHEFMKMLRGSFNPKQLRQTHV